MLCVFAVVDCCVRGGDGREAAGLGVIIIIIIIIIIIFKRNDDNNNNYYYIEASCCIFFAGAGCCVLYCGRRTERVGWLWARGIGRLDGEGRLV